MPTTTLYPSHDATIRSNNITTNYNSELQVQIDTTSMVMKFDLSSIPSNATITSAVLSLKKFNDGGINNILFHYGLDPSWVESTVTFGNYDGFDSAFFANIALTKAGQTNVFEDFEIKTGVQAWVSGTKPNYGMCITWGGGGSSWQSFYTKEAGNVGDRPYLTVTYTTKTKIGTTKLRTGSTTVVLPLYTATDIPSANQLRTYKGGQVMCYELGLTTDPKASPLRVRTTAGTRAVLKE